MNQLQGPLPPMFFVAVRPSRWQLSLARLWLLFCAPRTRPVGTALSLWLGLIAGSEFLFGVTLPSIHASLSSLEVVALAAPVSLAAGLTVLLARWHARDDLEQAERAGGALVGLGPREFSLTERGSTLVCGWELVRTHESPLGLIFELPWRRFCLVSYEALAAGPRDRA